MGASAPTPSSSSTKWRPRAKHPFEDQGEQLFRKLAARFAAVNDDFARNEAPAPGNAPADFFAEHGVLEFLTDRKKLDEQLDKAKARFDELKESVGFKTAA